MRRSLDRSLPHTPVDLVVIGAGINGAGIARDAALRGLRVVLVDKDDIASGTTSWSTRLIHGGLRYLEHLEISLVRESLRERERLLANAPHLVRPLSFFIPVYERDRRGPWTIRAGMVAYDTLSLDKREERHHMLDAHEAREREPGIAAEGLEGAAVYYDAQAEYPERLAVENVIDAYEHGVFVQTHRRVERVLVEDGRAMGVELAGGETVRGTVTINVAGPWVDQLLEGIPSLPQKRLIGGTKGAHLVVERFSGAPDEALYVEASDGRPYFIVPWNELFLIGTTDTRYDGDLDDVVATDEEIEYLVGATNEVIPGASLSRDAVVYTYAGVRPLPEAEGSEGSVTRRHIIHDHAPEVENLLSIVGGKLTTFRGLAEEAVDAAAHKLERKVGPSQTRDTPLPGGARDHDSFRDEFVADSGLERRVAERLVRIYGLQAEDVLSTAESSGLGASTLDETTGALAAEVVYALETELARDLADVLLRRTMVGLGPTVGVGPDERAARIAAEHAGWDDERAREQVAAYRDSIRQMRPRTLERPRQARASGA